MRLVGFSGYARAGKDTAYSLLADDGWNRIAFADPMRKFLYKLNPIVGEVPVNDVVRVSEVIDDCGWDGYKESQWGSEMRELMQRLGTECGREILGDNIWVNTALDNLAEGNYAVTDCRFVNEADAIRERGGVLIRIERPGIGPANSHASETSLDSYEFDVVINNDGTLEEFKRKLQKAVWGL